MLAAQTTTGVEVAIDFYKLLQISHVASRETAVRAYDRCISSPPEVGYSQQTLLARGSILKGALDTLLDPTTRKDYDERMMIGDIVESVPVDYVAGTLALLQETGEAAAVAAAGETWLGSQRRQPGAADVALAVALAQCDLAQAALEGQGDVLASVGCMEAALRVLRQHSPGSELEPEVEGALKEMQPQMATALLALPLEEEARRRRGLEVAQSLLLGAGRGVGVLTPAGRDDFVQRMAGSLTAAEQVEMYESCGASFAETSPELYTVALAYIAEGARHVRPAQLQRAIALLLTPAPFLLDIPDSQRERRVAEERNRRTVALSVAQLLLGDSLAAEDTLGLTQEGGTPKCDRVVLQFIKSNSPDRTDLLPGLCVLAQRWVHDVAFGSFRTASADADFSLDAWFADPQVQRAIKTLEKGGSLDTPPATNALVSALNSGLVLLTLPFVEACALVLAVLGLLDTGRNTRSRMEPRGGQRAEDALGVPAAAEDVTKVDMRDSRRARQEAWQEAQVPAPAEAGVAPARPLGSSAAPTAGAAASPQPPLADGDTGPSDSPDDGLALIIEDPRAPVSSGPALSAPPSPAASAGARTPLSAPTKEVDRSDAIASAQQRSGDATWAGDAPAGERRPSGRAPREGSSPARPADVARAGAMVALDSYEMEGFASQPVARPPPLAGEELMMGAYQSTYVRWGRIATAALVLVGSVFLGRAATLRWRAPAPTMPSADVSPVAGRPKTAAAAHKVDVQSAPAATTVAAAKVAALTKMEAAELIDLWHQIKSAALGPKHAVGKLDRVLTGQLLQQWRDRAEAIKEKGWHYTHTLEGHSVDSMAPGPSPGTAAVTATFRENATLHKRGEQPQAYRSEYSVTYELVKVKGKWKLSSATVKY